MKHELLLALGCFLSAVGGVATAQAPFSFAPSGDTLRARAAAVAVDLTDNAFDHRRILIAGGYSISADGNWSVLRSAEIFHARDGSFTPTGSMKHSRRWAAAIAVVSTRLDRLYYDAVVFGGDIGGGPPRRNYEVYDAARGRFIAVRPLLSDRFPALMARSGNGQFGGFVLFGGRGARNSAEVHDPNEVTLEALFPPFQIGLHNPRADATATKLRDGRILIAGGSGSMGNTAEIYDPATGQTTQASNLLSARRSSHTATPIGPHHAEKILIAGGIERNDTDLILAYHASAEIFDPATNRFSPTGSMGQPRWQHTATAFSVSPNGRKVLITGGRNGPNILASAEIYDVETGTFTAGPDMAVARFEHVAIPARRGRILIVGGHTPVGTRFSTTRKSEIFRYQYTP